MEVLSSIMETMGHVFAGVLVWKIVFGGTVIISGIFNVACWILEAVAVWEALSKAESNEHRFLWFKITFMPVIEMVIILIGIACIVLSALTVIYAQAFGMIILGIIGIIMLSMMSQRVKKTALAVFYLVLDMGLVLLIRALIIGDGSSEAMLFGTSIIALLASVAITMMRGGLLVIENGKYVFRNGRR